MIDLDVDLTVKLSTCRWSEHLMLFNTPLVPVSYSLGRLLYIIVNQCG